MSIKIGDKTYTTRKPKDLDEKLLASTGCSAAELGALLAGNPLAGHVARAVHPFLADGGDIHELATAIAAHGIAPVAAEVRKLLGAEDATAAEGGESGVGTK